MTVKETLGQWKGLVFKGLLSLLTVRRFLGTRSMTLAVSELENLSGPARSQRCGVVARVGGGQAFLVTLGGLVLEALGLLCIYVIAVMFIPQGQNPGWDSMVLWLQQGGLGPKLLILGAGLGYGLLVLLLEPIYLASGFALYLNSRTRQEAWDIELQFRELAARVNKTRVVASVSAQPVEKEDPPAETGGGPKFKLAASKPVALPAFFLGLFALFAHSDLQAEDPQVVIEEVLSDEAFEIHTEKYKEKVRKDRDMPDFNSPSAPGVDGLFMVIGYLALALLVCALLVLIVNLASKRSLGVGPSEKKFKRPPPTVVMGMEVTPESLPDDILAQARLYWSKGQAKLALSLLYRGALTKLITEKEVAIESSDTESECVKHVEHATPGSLSVYFKDLSFQWMKAAYSTEEVRGDDFEGLLAQWPFERRAN